MPGFGAIMSPNLRRSEFSSLSPETEAVIRDRAAVVMAAAVKAGATIVKATRVKSRAAGTIRIVVASDAPGMKPETILVREREE